jgi:hypothetical protein
MNARALVTLACLLACGVAHAHKPSDSYLRLADAVTVGGEIHVPLRWDVAVRDLDRALQLDVDRNGEITWGEVRRADEKVRAYLLAHLAVASDGHGCALTADAGLPQIVRHSDGAYVLYALTIACAAPAARLTLDYHLFFDIDPQHRGLLRNTGGGDVVLFTHAAPRAEVSLHAARSRASRLASAIAQGVHHIWTGYDHMLFLLALLLPAVLRREGGRWVPVDRLRTALIEVLKVVTAFTAAHSVTLSLAALGFLSLPSRLVESAIAASVVLAALNNLVPLVRADRWLGAFALGLLHGFGFSSTLADLGLSGAALLPTLVGFNIGVELGQAAVVAAFVPLAFAARRKAAYRWGALQLGSAIIAIIAALWLYERAFGVVIISR